MQLHGADAGQLVFREGFQLRALAEEELQDRRRSYDGVPSLSRNANLGSLGRRNSLIVRPGSVYLPSGIWVCGEGITMVCWNCSSIFSSSSAAMPTTAAPQTPGRSSIALDRTMVRLQIRAYTRPASMQASYRALKLVEIGTATAFQRPPEMPTRCDSGLLSPGLSNSGSRFAVLRVVSKCVWSGRRRKHTPTSKTLSRHRAAWRGPCQLHRMNGDISGRALGSWNKPRSSPARSGPCLSPRS